jgi:hypothetical protein
MLERFDISTAPDLSFVGRPPRRLHSFVLRCVPRPAGAGGVADDNGLGGELRGVGQSSFRLRHQVQAKLEHHGVSPGAHIQKVARDERELVGQTGFAGPRGKPLDRGLVPIDGDHAASGPNVLDELAAARPDHNDRLVGDVVERQEIRHNLADVSRYG